MAAGEDRRLKTRTASCQNLKILPFCAWSRVSGVRAVGYLAGVFVVVDVGDVVKLKCWCRGWTSEQIVECSPIARLLFIGMWNFCDDGGNHLPAQRR